jgi:RimJ/RimL family protein N-acetyltransferase
MLSVREIQEIDIEKIADYWLNADKSFLEGMGVDTRRVPLREQWQDMLKEQIITPIPQKQSWCLIWERDRQPVGHSNINKITFGEEAYMHIHMWERDTRHKGIGLEFIKMCIPKFLETYHLQRLYCEPYALNPAPNKVLEKLGFRFCKTYTTTPGWINFEQQVNLWELTVQRSRFKVPG